MSTAEEAKQKGNEEFKSNNYNTAIEHFSRAIALSTDNAFLLTVYSNRSAAYLKLNQYESALADASKCHSMDKKFIKGYIRQIEALQGKMKFKEALQICETGLLIDANDKSLLEKKRQLVAASSTGNGSFYHMLQRYLRLFLFANILLYFLPFGFGKGSYMRCAFSEITLCIMSLFINHGFPKFTSIYLEKIISDPYVMKLFHAGLILFGRPFFIPLFSIFFSELTFLTPELFAFLNSQLPLLESKFAPLLARYAPQIQFETIKNMLSTKSSLNNFNFQLIRLAAFSDVMQGVYLTIELIFPIRNLMFTMLWWQFLQARYMLDKTGHVKVAFMELDRQIMMVLNHRLCPSMILTGYNKLKTFLANKVSMQQQSSGGNSGGVASMLSKCTIM